MNFLAPARFFAPTGIPYAWTSIAFWFHWIPIGAPWSLTAAARLLQSAPMDTSLSASMLADSAPVSQNFGIADRMRDIDLNARSMSSGYNLFIGTPSAISANSRLGVPDARSGRVR